MLQVGNRIVYNQNGTVISQSGEYSGNVIPHPEITTLHYVDLPYGSIDYSRFYIVGVNPKTKQPVLREIPSMTQQPQE